MNPLQKYLALMALLPLLVGASLLTGQNVFFHLPGVEQPHSAIFGLALEIAAMFMVLQSGLRWAILVVSWLFILASPLLVGWGIIIAMFSGFGDGASKGAGYDDVLVWFVGGVVFIVCGIVSIRRNPSRKVGTV